VLFGQALREQGEERLVYSAPVGQRVAFAAIAAVIVASVAVVGTGPLLSRLNLFSVALVAVCIFAAVYLERWTFDREANRFERNVGILPLYHRDSKPLDSLRKVILRERGGRRGARPATGDGGPAEGPTPLGILTRGAATLCVVDQEGREYRLDIVRGSAASQLRKCAERLSAFCSIPMEEETEEGRA